MVIKFRKDTFFIITLIILVFINDSILVPLPGINTFFNYNISQWGVTYQNGFIFRGLIGTIITSLSIDMTDYFVYYSLVSVLTILVICIIYMINFYKISPGINTFLFLFFIISQPSNIRWWKSYGMFASMDMFIFLFLVLCLFVLIKFKNQVISISLCVILSVISMMINEYYIFIFFPLFVSVMMYWQIKNKSKIDLVAIFGYTVPVIIACIFIYHFGLSKIDPAVLNENIRTNLKTSFEIPHIYNIAYDNLYYYSICYKIKKVLIGISSIDIIKLVITLLLLLPSIFIYTGLMINGYTKMKDSKIKKIFIACIASVFFPLLGIFVTRFYYMWIGYVILAITVLIFALIFIDDNFKQSTIKYIEKRHIVLGVIGIYNICLGVFYVSTTYVWVETLIKQLS